jgi:hypothetical protein
MSDHRRLAELGYSEKYGKVELVVPNGVKSAELAKFSDRIFGQLVAQLPRGCQACLSGESFNIRERLEHVLQVDLEKMEVVGRG